MEVEFAALGVDGASLRVKTSLEVVLNQAGERCLTRRSTRGYINPAPSRSYEYTESGRYISNPREPDDPFPWSLASPADQQIPVKVDPGGRSEKGYPKKSLVKDPTGEFLMTTLL